MPRNPDMPCADCGKMMWRGRSSLPEGQARCRECRRQIPAPPRVRDPRRMTCIACGGKASSTRCRPCATAYRWPNAQPSRERKRKDSRQRYYRDRAAPGLNSEAKRAVLLKMWQRHGRGCYYCPGKAESVDHVVPLVLGGTNYEGNLVPCCISCNSNKGDRLVIEWRLAKRVKAERVAAVAGPPLTRTVVDVPTVKVCVTCGVLHFQEGEHCSSHRWDRALVGLRA